MRKNTSDSVNRISFTQVTDSIRIFVLYVLAFSLFIPVVLVVSVAGLLSVLPELFKNSAGEDDWKEHRRLSHFYTTEEGENNDRL